MLLTTRNVNRGNELVIVCLFLLTAVFLFKCNSSQTTLRERLDMLSIRWGLSYLANGCSTEEEKRLVNKAHEFEYCTVVGLSLFNCVLKLIPHWYVTSLIFMKSKWLAMQLKGEGTKLIKSAELSKSYYILSKNNKCPTNNKNFDEF